LKFRIGRLCRVLMQKWSVAAACRAGDIYPALEKGTIDARKWVGPYD